MGIDENISYVGAVNKERVTKEYYIREKKIWKSELSSFKKNYCSQYICQNCTDKESIGQSKK